MNNESLMEMIKRYREGNREIFMTILEKMNPLLNHYVWKLNFMEREDARQELIAGLLEGIQKISYVRSEGECINYVKACVRHTYLEIVRKEQKYFAERLEEERAVDRYGAIEYCEVMMDLERYIDLLDDRKRQIATKIVKFHKTDEEISLEMEVTRQYVNKIRNKMKKYVENVYLQW